MMLLEAQVYLMNRRNNSGSLIFFEQNIGIYLMHTQSAATGLRFLAQGFALIRQPGLRRFVIIPLLINSLLFIAAFFSAIHFIALLNAWLADFLPSWLIWLSWVVWLLFAGTGLIFVYYTFTLFAVIISSPFNSLLAEQVEYHLSGQYPPSARENWRAALKDIPRCLQREWTKLCYFLPHSLLLLLLCLIPLLQFFMPIITLLFSAWVLALQYLDYPLDNHRISFEQVRLFTRSQRWQTLGFGAGVVLMMLIPVVNLLVIPAAVAGATAWAVEQKLYQQLNAPELEAK